METIRTTLLKNINSATLEIQLLNSKIKVGNKQLLELAQQGTDQVLAASIGKELEAQAQEVARIADNATERNQEAQLQNLVWQVNDAVKSNRLAAVERLIDEHRSSRTAIELAIDLLSQSHIETLTASGRINVLVFLRNTNKLTWDKELRDLASKAIDLIRERSTTGEAQIGPQTDEALRRLETFLNEET